MAKLYYVPVRSARHWYVDVPVIIGSGEPPLITFLPSVTSTLYFHDTVYKLYLKENSGKIELIPKKPIEIYAMGAWLHKHDPRREPYTLQLEGMLHRVCESVYEQKPYIIKKALAQALAYRQQSQHRLKELLDEL